MLDREVTVINPLGLHARAAAQLVRLANTFCSDVRLKREDMAVDVDAKSILNVLYIAASKGVELHIITNGQDEAEAMSAVEALFTSGFGEI